MSNFSNFGTYSSREKQDEMLDTIRKMNNEYQKTTFIDVNDTIDFQCQRCGACCLNRDDVVLTGYDIYRASKYLNIECIDFIKTYANVGLQDVSKAPYIYLKTNKRNGHCPFLNFDYMHDGVYKCKIQDAKPGACMCHPLGIMSICDEDNIDNMETTFIKMDQCDKSKVGHMIKVRDHMSYYFEHEEENNLAHILNITVSSCFNWRLVYFMSIIFSSGIIRNSSSFDDAVSQMKDDVMTRALCTIVNIVLEYVYYNFDTNKPFIPQAKENLETIKKLFVVPGNEHEQLMDSMRSIFENYSGEDPANIINEADKNNTDLNDVIREFVEGKRKFTYEGFKSSEIKDD